MNRIKNVRGYEGLYIIDEYGNVFSITLNKYLSKQIDKDGYEYVTLFKNSISRKFKIHRLVAEAFIPNPNNYPVINHKDENKLNNNIDNLEWCTVHYNLTYGTKNIRSAIARGKKVECIETGKIYNTITEASKETGMARETIRRMLKGNNIRKHRYTFKEVV